MKMKSSMKLKAIMIITMLGMNLAGCAQAQKKDVWGTERNVY